MLAVREALERQRDAIDAVLIHIDTPYGRAPHLEHREVVSRLLRIFGHGNRILLPFEEPKTLK
jgi:hypothetical protein